MTALEQVRRAVIAALCAAGVNAVGEYDAQHAAPLRAPVMAVGLKSACAEKSGFLEYLGEREDEVRGTVEVYGRRMRLELSLAAFSPRGAGAAPCEALSEAAVQALTQSAAAGVRIEAVEWAQTQWDERYGAFLRTGCARASAYFTAEAAGDDGAVVTDFVLKGVIGNDRNDS